LARPADGAAPRAPLSGARIAAGLTTRAFGRPVEYHARVGSTNDLARERAGAGAPEGLLVVSDEQTAGRGRRGQRWLAPPGGAILASLLLRPRFATDDAFAPTMILGLAVCVAARAWGAPAVLKWPNDVFCGGRKLAGILCEMAFSGGRAEFVVAGFGVNVGFDPRAVGLDGVATSLSAAIAGAPPGRVAVLDRILGEAETRYGAWQAGGYEALWQEWRDALVTLGAVARVDPGDGAILTGLATRVEHDGALVLDTATGERRVVAGSVLPG
jgi:BirA family transcriptional regulator, biotin operon repressor / biotin---[acetyl-CoA-carboxylase] ligase